MDKYDIKKDAEYLDELSIRLRTNQIHCAREGERLLTVTLDGKSVGTVVGNGDMIQHKKDLDTPEARELFDCVLDHAKTVHEYLRQMGAAPFIVAEDLPEKYKLLAEYKNTVFCGCQNNNGLGVQFVTWSYTYDRKGVTLGHYFGNDYQSAKQDFAVRSGLVQEQRIFSDEQLSEIYRCVKFTKENALILTDASYKTLQKISDKIEQILPDAAEYTNNAPAQEMKMDMD